MTALTSAVVCCSIEDAFTLVAPRAWPPNEFDHIIDQTGNVVAVRRPTLFRACDGAQGRGARFRFASTAVALCGPDEP
jgi:hypothetical protein